jgi:hypothetical protein
MAKFSDLFVGEQDRIASVLSNLVEVFRLVDYGDMPIGEHRKAARWLSQHLLTGELRLPDGSIKIVYKTNPARNKQIERHVTLRESESKKQRRVLTYTQLLGYPSEVAHDNLSEKMVADMTAHGGVLLIEL